MSNTNGSTTLRKSMNGLIDINDGAGTDISDGNITCNTLTTKTFQTDTFTATTLSDGVCQISNGNITGVNTLACNTFQCSTFSAANLSGNLVESVTSQSQTFNIVDTASYTLGLFLNMASFFTSYISTLDLSNGWKWFNGPTLTTCMILDTAGKLQTNSLQPLSSTTDYNLLTNQTTGAINIGSVSTGAQNININNNSTGTTTINNTLIKTNAIQSGSPTSFYSLLANHTGTISLGSASANVNVQGNLVASSIIPFLTGYAVGLGNFLFTNYAITSNALNTAVSMFSGYLGSVSIGGSGGVNLAKQGNYYIEVNAAANAYIDFHSSNTTSDYDSRIIATSGTSTAGNGTINIIANTIQLYSNPFRYIPLDYLFRNRGLF